MVAALICADETETLIVGVVLFFGAKSMAYQEFAGTVRDTTPPEIVTVVGLPVAHVLAAVKATLRAHLERVNVCKGEVVMVKLKPAIPKVPVLRR